MGLWDAIDLLARKYPSYITGCGLLWRGPGGGIRHGHYAHLTGGVG